MLLRTATNRWNKSWREEHVEMDRSRGRKGLFVIVGCFYEWAVNNDDHWCQTRAKDELDEEMVGNGEEEEEQK